LLNDFLNKKNDVADIMHKMLNENKSQLQTIITNNLINGHNYNNKVIHAEVIATVNDSVHFEVIATVNDSAHTAVIATVIDI
jgi:hypothetical protein